MQSNWKTWVKPWVPPIVLDLYRSRTQPISLEKPVVDEPPVQFILPVLRLDELYPDIESTEVSVAVSQITPQHYWASPLTERLCLAAICQRVKPQRIFEIGTFTGSSTLLMAMNTPRETEIFTLDLNFSDTGVDATEYPKFTVGESYQGTPFEKKIHQMFGDSRSFDYSEFYGSVDIVFIDAVHTYDFVKTDTDNAFKLLKPGGIIIWDDYLWEARFPECAGVTRCVNELSESKQCFQIAGTRLAIYIDKNP